MLSQHHHLLFQIPQRLPLPGTHCLAMEIQRQGIPPVLKSTLPHQPPARSFNPANLVLLTVLAAQRPQAVSVPQPLQHFRAKLLILSITGLHRHTRLSSNNIQLEFQSYPNRITP